MENSNPIGVCLVMLLAIGAFVGGIVLIVYSGIALGHDSRSGLLDQCPDADIWSWLLVVTIIMGVQMLGNASRNKSKSSEEKSSSVVTIVVLVFTLGLQVGLAAWGGPMILSDCAIGALQDTQVWRLSFIHFVVQLVLIALVALIGMGGILLLAKTHTMAQSGDADAFHRGGVSTRV